MSLTDKQAAFVREYLIDLNATAAYKRAGYTATGNAAEASASRLLSNAKVAAEIAAAQAERAERTKVDSDWVLTRLADEAVADLADIYDEHGNLKSIHEWPLIWRQGLVAGIETVQEKVGEDEAGRPGYATVRKVRLSDRIKRVDLIGKHVDVQAFKEKVDVTVTNLADVIAQRRKKVSDASR